GPAGGQRAGLGHAEAVAITLAHAVNAGNCVARLGLRALVRAGLLEVEIARAGAAALHQAVVFNACLRAAVGAGDLVAAGVHSRLYRIALGHVESAGRIRATVVYRRVALGGAGQAKSAGLLVAGAKARRTAGLAHLQGVTAVRIRTSLVQVVSARARLGDR